MLSLSFCYEVRLEVNMYHGILPTIFEYCLSEVESRGLREARVVPLSLLAYSYKPRSDSGGYTRNELPQGHLQIEANIPSESRPIATDIRAIQVFDLVKSCFPILPEPVFPSSSDRDVINIQ